VLYFYRRLGSSASIALIMSFLTEAFHKITTCRKTPAAQTIFNPRHSSSTVDSSPAADMLRLQDQCVQSQVGMYSVLTIGDHLDVVVRFEQSLPYILPVSADEDCPQVTYVVPRQDMKVGDSFTLFVEREHFLVKVVQFLLKSDPSTSHDSQKDSDSSTMSNASRRRPEVQPLESSPNTMHSRPLSPSTGRRRDRDAPRLPPSSQPISKPVTNLPLVTPRPNRGDETIFSTRTRADDGKIQNTTRAKVVTSSSRPSDKIHRANPSNKHDISGLDINISVQATTTPLSPLTKIQPSRSRLEIPLPPKHSVIMNTEFQAPLPTLDSSVLVQAEYTRREHVFKSPSIKKTRETNREPSTRLNTSTKLGQWRIRL
jgi:hypothetical protein